MNGFHEFIHSVKSEQYFPSEMAMRMKMLFVIVLFAIFYLTVLGLNSVLGNDLLLGVMDLSGLLLLVMTLYYLNKTKNYYRSTYFGVTVIGILFLFLLATGGASNSGHLWLFTYPLFTFFLLGSKRGIIVNATMIFFAFSIFIFGHLLNNTIHYPSQFIFRFIPSYLLIVIYSFTFEELRKQSHQRLLKQKKDLEETVNELQHKKDELKKFQLNLENLVEERTKQLNNEIEARKKDQEKIAESERRFRLLFESSPIGMYVTTPGGNVIMVNNALVQMLGFPSEAELLKINIESGEYFSDYDRNNFKKEIAEKGKITGLESVWKKFNGEPVHVKENAVAIKDKSGEILYYQGTVEDITKVKEFEDALIRAKEKAEISDKLKSEFLAQISHEIRTPVNSILSFTNLVREEIIDLGITDILESFNMIDNGGKRLIRTVDLILNMSELQNGTYKPTFQELDLVEDIVKPVISEFKIQAESKNLIFEFRNSIERNTYIYADDYTATQIFVQLIDNALKFTHAGKVEILTEEDKDIISVKIKDSGIGISKDYQEKLFKPFCQEERGYTRKFEGNGLGLSLVKKCCDINNAAITVDSKKNIGTTFTITFTKFNPKNLTNSFENTNSGSSEKN